MWTNTDNYDYTSLNRRLQMAFSGEFLRVHYSTISKTSLLSNTLNGQESVIKIYSHIFLLIDDLKKNKWKNRLDSIYESDDLNDNNKIQSIVICHGKAVNDKLNKNDKNSIIKYIEKYKNWYRLNNKIYEMEIFDDENSLMVLMDIIGDFLSSLHPNDRQKLKYRYRD